MSATVQTARPVTRPLKAEQPARLLGLGLIVLVLSLIPYLCGYLLSPPGKAFLGALNNVGDLSQYLATIRQGAHGAWHYTNQFTPDHARPLIMYTPYLLAGHLSFGAPTSLVFQALRLVCATVALVALAAFCRLYVGSYVLRAAWLFVLLAGGLYWLALPLSAFAPHLVDPASLTAPELSPLLTLLISPHESLGLGAEILGFICILRASGAGEGLWSEERPRSAAPQPGRARLLWGAAASFLVLALSYPFLLPTVGLVLLTYAVVAARTAGQMRRVAAAPRRRMRARGVFLAEMRPIVITLIPAGVIGVYYLLIFRRDPLWSHSGLTQVGRPDVSVLVFAFGALAIGAYAGARRLQALRLAGGDAAPAAWAWFPLIWALINAGMLLLPIWQQGRQALGLSVPLALLSFLALAGSHALHGRARPSLPPFRASALAFSSPLLLALYTAISAGGVNSGYYTPSSVMEAVRWLGAHTRAQDVVLSSAGFGNLAPEECTCRVVIGQNFQSFDWNVRQAEVHSFYAARTARTARAALATIVRREHVTYVVYSPLERNIGRTQLKSLPGFTQRYNQHDVVIFGRGPTRG